MAEEQDLTFEQALKRLEAIVEQLEEEDVELEESIELYEEGMKLSGQLTDTLEQAEQRIEQVNKQHASSDNDSETD